MDIAQIRHEIDVLIAGLNFIITNFAKAPNRAYSKKFLINKKKQATNSYKLINDCLAQNEDKFAHAELNFIIKGVRQKYNDILVIVNEKLVHAKDQISSIRTIALIYLFYIKIKRRQGRMALTVDVKLGTSLVPIYDGKSENLDSFIDAVRLFEDTVNQTFANGTSQQKNAAAQTVVRFVRTRLTGKARQTINENQTLNEMLGAIRVHCASKITADSLIAKLKTIRQNGDLTDFCEKIDSLCGQLKSVYLKDEIPQDTANKMATKCGIDALIRGARNNDSRIILKAGSFDKITDAIQKLMENETEGNSSATTQIFTVGKINNQSRGRISNNNRGQQRGHFHNYRGIQNNFPRNPFSRGNYNNNRGNFHNRGYRSNRGYSQNRGSFSQRGPFNHNYGMFYAQNIPQQPQLQQQNIPQS